MDAIAVPCPDCTRQIDTFRITVNPNNTLVLHATCHPCRTVHQLTLTFDDLRDLCAGREVPIKPSQPELVMCGGDE